ncbi:MAG: DUF6160 family protein [Marinobacter sp.]|nr:DUF6160 family protein [Marinobacter sp.]
MHNIKTMSLLSALSLASTPLLASGLQPLDEDAMREIAGQAGVTIELDVRAEIERIAYSHNDGAVGSGALLVDGIRLNGGSDGAGGYKALQFQMDVDIAASGDAVISLRNREDANAPFTVAVQVDKVGLSSSMFSENIETTLISNIDISALVGNTTITAQNSNPFDGGNGQGSLVIESSFAVDNMELDVDVLAMRIEGIRVAKSGNLETLKDGGAITGAMMSEATITLGPGYRLSDTAGSQPTALRASFGDSNLDVWVGDIQIGGGSVGSLAIQGLNLNGSEMSVYGR